MSTIDRFDLPPPGRSDDFQKFVRDLFAEDCGDPYAQEHGRSGHSQNGTDIVAYRWKDKAWVGIQCKQRSIHSKSGITVGELQNEVSQAKALDPPLTHFILATTSRRDPKLQQEARRITTKNAKSGSFTVNVVSWDDLVDMLRRYPSVAELWYPAFKSKRRNTLNSQSKPRLIPASLQRTLGMIATCPFAQRIEWLSKLNAEIDWSGDVHLLEHSQFVSVEDDGEIKIDELVLSQMFATPPDRRPYLEDWTKVLMPIRGHCDVNLYLGMMTAELQGLPAAIQYFIEGALAAPRGGWCRLYSSVLTQLSESRRLKSLAPAERIDILNALVHCQLGDRAFAEGLKTIRRLNAMASQSGNTWMVGQCLLNRGVAEWESRGVKQAIHFFEKAISFGRSNGDAELTWKSLSNLAAAKIDQGEYDEAIALITESRQERIRDHRKGYSPSLLILRADVEGKRGHHQKALKLYQRAENEAKRSNSFALAASCAINIGNSLASLGRVEEAIQAYQSARTIAEQDELIVIEEQAREAEAYLRLRSGSYEKAATLLQELVEFRQKHKRDIEHIAVALHDRIAAYFQSGMTDVGFLAAKEAIEYCRENGLDHWIARTHHDVSTLLRQQGHHHEAFRYLRTQADVERRNGKRHISCKLQAELVEVLIVTSAGHAELLKEMKKCREWWSEFPKDFEGRCRLGELEFGLSQRSGESVQGVEILKKLVKLASKHEQKRYELRANAELGLQLVHLGLYDEAEPVLCLAKELARAANVPEMMSDVASTLGECLRRAGRPRLHFRASHGATMEK